MGRVDIVVQNSSTGRIESLNHICTNVKVSSTLGATAASLTLDILNVPNVKFRLGDEILLSIDSVTFFAGRLFTIDNSGQHDIRSFTFYDYTRYLANSVLFNMAYPEKLSEVFKTICAEMKIPVGRVDDSLYLCAAATFDNHTCCDILTKLADETLANANRQFIWRQRAGKMELVDIESIHIDDILTNMYPNIISFSNSESIDTNTVNELTIVKSEPPKAKKGAKGSDERKRTKQENHDLWKANTVSVIPVDRKKQVSATSGGQRGQMEALGIAPWAQRGGRANPANGSSKSKVAIAQIKGQQIENDSLGEAISSGGVVKIHKRESELLASNNDKALAEWKTGVNQDTKIDNMVGGYNTSVLLDEQEWYGPLTRIIETSEEITEKMINQLLDTLRHPTRTMSFSIIAENNLFYPGMRIQVGLDMDTSTLLINGVTTIISNKGVIQEIETIGWQNAFAKLGDAYIEEARARQMFFTEFHNPNLESARVLLGKSLEGFGAEDGYSDEDLTFKSFEVKDRYKGMGNPDSPYESRLAKGYKQIKF